jgi:hypothetical protein
MRIEIALVIGCLLGKRLEEIDDNTYLSVIAG